MEEVCLNSEPLFDERNEVDVEGNSSIAEHDLESLNSQTNNSPLPTVDRKKKECYRAKLSCSSAGFKKKSEANNPRPKTRTGCPAMIVIRMVESKRWRIVEVELQHDHQVSPQSKRFYKSHKEMILEASKSRPLPEPVTEVHTIRKHLKEAMADLESRKVSFELKTRCNFEVQLAKGFTKEIFQKFQSEVDGMYSCFNTRQVSVNGSIITYIVKESVEVEGNEKGVKSFEDLYETTELDIRCICSLFNYKGYLCKHALNVLNYNSIEEIPSQYILNRWRRDFKQTFNQFHVSDNIDTYNPVDLYTHLFNSALPVLEVGAQSREHYMVAV
ncbi:Protein FAR1-RELATED SEQUENCE 6 [Glycine soja]|nr:Protein FAR1-RELATED SEQUENCE 6 [Glycine soja]